MSFNDIIAALPYDTPALAAPEGVKSNFSTPYTRGPIIIAVGTVLFILVLVFAAARFYVSTFLLKKINLGDSKSILQLSGYNSKLIVTAQYFVYWHL